MPKFSPYIEMKTKKWEIGDIYYFKVDDHQLEDWKIKNKKIFLKTILR